MFRSARLPAPAPGSSLLASFLLHVGVVACLFNLPSLPNPLATRTPIEILKSDHTITWYGKTELLPAISPTQPKEPSKPLRKAPAAPEQFAFTPAQDIVSRPPKPDNRRQTIMQPEAPNVQIPAQVSIPNIVRWKDSYLPPKPSLNETSRELARISVPRLPRPVIAPPPRPLPEPPDLRRAMGDVKVSSLPAVELPKLPAPAVIAPAAPLPADKIMPAPLSPSLANSPVQGFAGDALRTLIAVGTAPAPPEEKLSVPAGNRAGEFALSPRGTAGARDSHQARAGEGSGDDGLPGLGGDATAEIHLPDLSISGGKPSLGPFGGLPSGVLPPQPTPPAVATPPPARPPSAPRAGQAPDLANLIARASRPQLLPELARGKPPEQPFFGGKRVYTLSINMPNLTSGSGSWVLLFSELNADSTGNNGNDELSNPVALRKIDPLYAPSAVRDRIEGTVMLAAHILRNGSVADVHVMRGVDPRLDASAVDALAGWQFLPAKKNGVSVDLEVLVQIPFRLPAF